MRIVRRILVWAAILLVLLFVAAALALNYIVPKERIIAELLPRAEAALGRPVTLGDAGIALWPPFGIYVEDVVVSNRPPARSEHLLAIEYVRARLRLWPLLRGRLHFDAIYLGGLKLYYETFADSSTNIDDLLAGEGGTPPLLAEKLELERVELHTENLTDTSGLHIQGLSARLTIEPQDTSFILDLTIGHLMWQTARDTIRVDQSVRAEMRGAYTAATSSIQLDTLEGAFAGIPLAGSGRLSIADTTTRVRALVMIGPVEFQSLRDGFPAWFEGLESYELTGQIRLDVSADGTLDSLVHGGIKGQLVWLGGRVTEAGREWLRFAALSVPFDAQGFHVSGEDVRLLGESLQVGVVGSWPPNDRLELTLSGGVDMSQLPVEAGQLRGHLTWSASGQGPLADLEDWRVRARVRIDSVTLIESGREPLDLDAGTADYDGASVAVEGLIVRSGRSRADVSAEATGLEWSRFLQDTLTLHPRAEVVVSSSYLDLDALFPGLAGDSTAPHDTISRPPFGAADLVARAFVDTLVAGGARWREVRATIRTRGDSLYVDTLSGRVFGGRAVLSGRMRAPGTEEPAYAFEMRADSVALDGLLSRFGSIARHLQGRGSLKADIEGRGFEPRQIMEQLLVDGEVSLFDAQLADFPAARAAQSLLDIDVRDPVPLRSFWNQFRLERGRLRFDAFVFQALDARWLLSGTAGLDGTLDYNIDAVFSRERSTTLKLPSALESALPAAWRGQFNPLDLFKNDSGQVELYLKAGGSYRKPSIQIDWSRLQPVLADRFETRVAAKLKQEAQDELKKGLNDLFKKLKP